MAQKPPGNRPPGEDRPRLELADVMRLYKRGDGDIKIGEGEYTVKDGVVRVGDLTYHVLSNLKTDVDIRTTSAEDNLLLDESCTTVGNINCSGEVVVLGSLKAKSLTAVDKITFYKKLEAEDSITSLTEGITGGGSLKAKRILAEENIHSRWGSIEAEVIESNSGSVVGSVIKGNKIYALGEKALGLQVNGMGDELLAGVIASGGIQPLDNADPSECLIWTPRGVVLAEHITTGKISAPEIKTLAGDLVLHGNGYCETAEIRGSLEFRNRGRFYYTKGLEYAGSFKPGEDGSILEVERLPYDPDFDPQKLGQHRRRPR